jgi:flagellar FliJ protein
MKRFRFRLERLLDLRSRAEREQARAYAQAIREEEEQRRVREAARDRLERCGEELAGATGGLTNAGTLRNLDLTVRAAANELEAAAESHEAAQDDLRTEADRFGEARKERRVVERLRERRRGDWEKQSGQDEQRECDALAQQRWLSKEQG